MAGCFGGIDPVEGLVQFTLDVKPYHTKILEVEVEYIYTDVVDVTITDVNELIIHLAPPPIEEPIPCSWGYGIAPFGEPFVQNQIGPFDIISVDEIAEEIVVSGDETVIFTAGSYAYGDVVVNDGSGDIPILQMWDVVSSSYNSGSDETTVVVTQLTITAASFVGGFMYSIPFGKVSLVDVDPQLNYFLINGDHRAAFTYGIQFDVVSSIPENNRQYSILGSGRATFVILSANDVTNSFIIDGDWTSYITSGDVIEIRYSTDYDGIWTVTSTVTSSGLTQINVLENVEMPADPFNINYGILLSDKLTRLQVTEAIFGLSYKIIDVDEGLDQFIIDGDQTIFFVPGKTFKIFGSATYDGQTWTVVSSTFDPGNPSGSPPTSPRTLVQVVEDIPSKTFPFGTMYFVNPSTGFVVPTFIGYSDVKFCDNVPKGKVMGHIGERLQITSAIADIGDVGSIFTDLTAGTVAESVNVNVVTSGGSLVGAFDYAYWDIGSFDEDYEVLIQLYGGPPA